MAARMSATPRARVWANRLQIRCPGCGEIKSLPLGGPEGWTFNGDLDRPTLSPSVLVEAAVTTDGKVLQPRCHSFIRDGRIEFLSDCTHALVGQVVDLPPLDP